LAERRIKKFSLNFNAPTLFEFEEKRDGNNGKTEYNTVSASGQPVDVEK